MQITQLFNNNSFPRANHPKFVILHGTAGGTSALAIAQYFQNAGVSAHYVIGQDGQIVQCNGESDGAYADGVIDGVPTPGLPFRTQSDGVHRDDWWNPNGINPNNEGIAIEHCKPSADNSDALTPAQQASSLWLVNDICNRWNIPKRFADASGGITGHFSIDAVSRQRCPGPYPWDALFDYLNENEEQPIMIDLSNPGVSQYFQATADPQIWQVKGSNILLGHGILDFYRSFGGSGLCGLSHLGLPTSNEISAGNGRVYQRLERGVLCYDVTHSIDNPPQSGPVYLMHIDKGLGQDPRIAQLQVQVGQLQTQVADQQTVITELQSLPSVQNLSDINKLGQQIVSTGQAIVKASQVQ